MRRVLLLLGTLLACGSSVFAQATFYVSTCGNDAWSGNLPSPNCNHTDGPFATLQHAKEASRALGTTSPRTIIIRGGSYYGGSIRTGSMDSGLTIEGAQDESPILYGGRRITNWIREGSFYTATLHKINNKPWDISMLLVNGRYAEQARLPHYGVFIHRNTWDVPWKDFDNGTSGWVRNPTEEDLTTLKYRPGDLGKWLDINNAEISAYYSWEESRVRLKSLDDTSHQVVLAKPLIHPIGAMSEYSPRAHGYVVWNVREGMNEPGQWYIDRTTNKIVYWPRANEDMRTAVVVAPTSECVIAVAGDPKNQARDITLKNLIISVTNAPQVSSGAAPGWYQGAISVYGAKNFRVMGVKVTKAGGTGLRMISSEDCRVENCEFSYLGGDGIYSYAMDRLVVRNNLVHHNGLANAGSNGIYLCATSDSLIEHNEAFAAPYCGIDGGFTNCRIQDNLFYDYMRGLMDGGAIHIGKSDNTIVTGNAAYGTNCIPYSHGYYIDYRSKNCCIQGNLAVNTRWPSQNNLSSDCKICDNIFIDDQSSTLRASFSNGFTFEKNIIVSGSGVSFINTNKDANDIIARNNLIDPGTGKAEFIGVQNIGNVYGNPMFIDPAAGNYTFGPDSPAFKLGFKPYNRKPGRLLTPNQIKLLSHFIDVLQPPALGTPGKVRVVLRNDGNIPVSGRLVLWFAPSDVIAGDNITWIPYALKPGDRSIKEVNINLNSWTDAVYAGLQEQGYPHTLSVTRIAVK